MIYCAFIYSNTRPIDFTDNKNSNMFEIQQSQKWIASHYQLLIVNHVDRYSKLTVCCPQYENNVTLKKIYVIPNIWKLKKKKRRVEYYLNNNG